MRKPPMDSTEWWNKYGLRHNSVGESFEESMKWAYEQGVLADQIQDDMGPVTMDFKEATEEKDSSVFDRLGILDDEEMMKVDGFDECIIGTVERFGESRVLLYDSKKIINSMVEAGMGLEEAWEYFSFNITGAWVGEGTPAFAYLADD